MALDACAVRGIYFFADAAFSSFAAAGFNTVPVTADQVITVRSAGLRSLVWLGSVDNLRCGWEFSDAQVVSIVQSLKGNRSVWAYMLGDEPDADVCPGAPALYRARTALIHATDPDARTFVNSPEFQVNQAPSHVTGPSKFADAVDYLGIEVYPYQRWASMPETINAAGPFIAQQNLGGRWVAVIQDFADTNWRWPTLAELADQFARWQAIGMCGYLVFAWDWQGNQLGQQAGHLDFWRRMNTGATAGPGAGPSPVPGVGGGGLAKILLALGLGAAALAALSRRSG